MAIPAGSALKGPLEGAGAAVYEVGGMADRSFHRDDVRALRDLIRELKPDLVHTHGALSGRVAARLEGRKVVYTKHCAFPPHGLMATPPGKLANRAADALLADGVLAVGQSARELLMASGIPERRIHVFYNGVAPIPAPTPEQRRQARAEYGFGDGDFVLGILARVEEYKGHGILLDALERLLAQGRGARVLIAGEGSRLPALKERAASLPPGSVVFAGFVREVERALWAMDLQINASTQSETSSLSLLEGMSMGLPAVVSSCGGNPDLIVDGENGLVFPNGDAAALAGCAARLMDRPEERTEMSRRARELYLEKYTGEIFAQNVENVYLDILKGANHGTKK